MKEKYIAPEMEIVEFDAEDVITTSFTNAGNAEDYGNPDINIP